MKAYRELLLLGAFLLFSNASKADEFIVTKTADDGSWGTLRKMIFAASINPGPDTVFIDVSGTIFLEASLDIDDQELTIIGPQASHLTIQPGAAFPGPMLAITNANEVSLSGIRFRDGPNTGVCIHVTAAQGDVKIENCYFDGVIWTIDNGTIWAEAADPAAVLTIMNCTFEGCISSEGGAIYADEMDVDIANCTFDNNQSLGNGGAIYTNNLPNGSIVRHCTFRFNIAGSLDGDCIYVDGSGGDLTVHNSVFDANNVPGGSGAQISGSGSSLIQSAGGNVFKWNNIGGDSPMISFTSLNDQEGWLINTGLDIATTNDGFGVPHFRISDQVGGLAADNGVITPGSWPDLMFDARRAPRSLFGDSSVDPDAGAFEATMLTVYAPGTGVGDFGSFPWALSAGADPPGPNYIEFYNGVAGPVLIFAPDGGLFNIDGTYIIDGFTHPSSLVPGPGVEGTPGAQSMVAGCELYGDGTSDHGIELRAASSDCRISGLQIQGCNMSGIHVWGGGHIIAGNLIGVDETGAAAQNSTAGIEVLGVDNQIGGYEIWMRNVIAGNAGGGCICNVEIEPTANGNIIVGNFVGTIPDGTDKPTLYTPDHGFEVHGDNTIIGGIGYGNRNLISGNNLNGIRTRLGSDGTTIINNYIGTDYDGLEALGATNGVNCENGINIIIGGYSNAETNIISANSNANILVVDAQTIDIFNNWIGPDSTGADTPGASFWPSANGIRLDAVGIGGDVQIGDFDPSSGNVISGNITGIGIDEIFSTTIIQNNYIGFEPDGLAPLGNANVGIHLRSPLDFPITIGGGVGNIIGNTFDGVGSGVGIQVDGGSGAIDDHTITSNIIGMNVSGTAAAGNFIGVRLNDCVQTVVGGPLGANSNYINGNMTYGIDIASGNNMVQVHGNKVGLETTETAAIGNTLAGIRVGGGNFGTIIGGSVVNRNIIGGHDSGTAMGILCEGTGSGGSPTAISANFIGLNQAEAGIPNYRGISVLGDHDAIIGGAGANRNYICNSYDAGIYVASPYVDIDGNAIGLDEIGFSPAGNQWGIVADATVDIGFSEGNIIAANSEDGILINSGGLGSVIDVNFIGHDGSGVTGKENGSNGILIDGAGAVIVGQAGAGNVIAGNFEAGIRVQGGAIGTQIFGNILYDPFGGNTNKHGIYLTGGSGSAIVGTDYYADRNEIADCDSVGLFIQNSNSNQVYGNNIGTDGSGALPNWIGIKISSGSLNTIGGQNLESTTTDDYNIISGNDSCGIQIEGLSSSNFIFGNAIGLDITYTIGIGNDYGIVLSGTAASTTIGGSLSSNRNFISGNGLEGIHVAAPANYIYSNVVGLAYPGDDVLASGTTQDYGVHLTPTGGGTIIGGTKTTTGGHFADNLEAGILMESPFNGVYGNHFGTTADGTFNAIGDQPVGIEISGFVATDNEIGHAPRIDSGNVFMNADTMGIYIANNAADNFVVSNNIGGMDDGTWVGDQPVGVGMFNTGTGNTIGDTLFGFGNIISRNERGILMDQTTGSFVYNNNIGTWAAFGSAPNLESGIEIIGGSTLNTVGGGGFFTVNTISANGAQNVLISGSTTTDNDVSGNIIGIAIDGTDTIFLAPSAYSVNVDNGANNNQIGKPDVGNWIGGADVAGVRINGSNINYVQANYIGTLAPNVEGVLIEGGSMFNLVGGFTDSEYNWISGNTGNGIAIQNSNENTVVRNRIGTNVWATDTFPNLGSGIYMENTFGNMIGDASFGENKIAGNYGHSIHLVGSTGDTIVNNNIGSNYWGTDTMNGSATIAGIMIENSSGVVVGGAADITENNINAHEVGIWLDNSTDCEIYGNNIGFSRNNLGILGNGIGVYLDNNSNLNQIGGTGGLGNRISGNIQGIVIDNSDNNSVQGNLMGTNAFGTAVLPADKQVDGIVINVGSNGNLIGGSSGLGNLVSGHLLAGISIYETSLNVISGNAIGVNGGIFPGTDSVPNLVGIYMFNSFGNRVGLPSADGGNIISGNLDYNIWLDVCMGDTIQNNYLGMRSDLSDTLLSCGTDVGIFLSSTSDAVIGGDMLGLEGNTIVNHDSVGIYLNNSSFNEIFGNQIGITATDQRFGNDFVGIGLEDASDNNQIGLSTDNKLNVISYNETGIIIDQSSSNTIGGNLIGPDNTGTTVVATDAQEVGVIIGNNSTLNYIVDENTISGNDNFGIEIWGTGTSGNEVYGNQIGTDVFGTGSLGNGDGVRIWGGANSNTIGGPGSDRNVISANITSAVGIFDPNTTNNTVAGNLIGTNKDSTALLAPQQYGIGSVSANGNFFGGTDPDETNWIAGTDSVAIFFAYGAQNNVARNNTVGMINSGTADPTNTIAGVFCLDADSNQIGGIVPLAANILTNCQSGVELEFGSTGNSITGNSMYAIDNLGIDINGDYLVEPIDTAVDAAGDNYELDMVEIVEAYACDPAENTRVGYRLTVPPGDYLMEFYIVENGSGPYGVGQTFVGRDTISHTAVTWIDTLSSELDLNVGTVDSLTATITHINGSTSEFSRNFQPTLTPPELLTNTVITTTDSIYCPGDSIHPIFATGVGIDWFDDFPTNVVAEGSPFVPNLLPGRNAFWAASVSPAGCSNNPDSIVVILSDTSQMYAIPDQYVCHSAVVQLDAFGGVAYEWDGNADLDDLNVSNPVAQTTMETEYYVTITDTLFCQKRDTVRIFYLPQTHEDCDIEIFTAFSPNGDGDNDYWHIDGIEGYDGVTVLIFNRWGDRVRKITDYDNMQNAWFGEMGLAGGGGDAPTGTYFFVMEIEGNDDLNRSGWIQLMR